jgi:hypothetical protein
MRQNGNGVWCNVSEELKHLSSPIPPRFFFCYIGAMASEEVQFIITEELDMQKCNHSSTSVTKKWK